MTYSGLRFSDVQRIRSFEINEDSVHGTPLNCKTKKQRGQFWPRARPREGVTGSRVWVQPLLDMRTAFRRINGNDTTYTFMRIDHAWGLIAADAAPYIATRRKLALLSVAVGDTDGEIYTPHSPKNLFPTAANQLRFDQRELNIIGRWASSSKMPERYDRSARSNELSLRNTIVQRILQGWEMEQAFHLPATVNGAPRIGRDEVPKVEAPTGFAKFEELATPVPTQVSNDGLTMPVPTQVSNEGLTSPVPTQESKEDTEEVSAQSNQSPTLPEDAQSQTSGNE